MPYSENQHGLSWLIDQLDALGSAISETAVRRLLTRADLDAREVARYIEPHSDSYARRAVIRREKYEVLVLTWLPGQGSAVHDHSGSLCGLKVSQGSLVEQTYDAHLPDGQARAMSASTHIEGGVIVDPGVIVHSLSNPSTSTQALVTVHVYSPPLPEIRRYAVATAPPARVFVQGAPSEARVIAIIGGGFTGAMTLANLLRHASQTLGHLHLVLIDRQPAVGEGAAYRTNDSRHLLNVPAGKMSAWADRPNDFLNFCRANDPAVAPQDFLPRKLYGQYVRQQLLNEAESASPTVTAEIIRDEAVNLTQDPSESAWLIKTASGRSVCANVAIITLGHRPPDGAFSQLWKGPRNRLVADPWAALVLSQIGPDEPVLLLGSGLTAVDAILTLDRPDRTAPLIVVSRRGLLPQPHTRQPKPAIDLSLSLAPWLDGSEPLRMRELVRFLRASGFQDGVDWRQIVDGLRPFTAELWERLSQIERARFLRHVRPFWEVHRHRMAPEVADKLQQLRTRGILELIAGSLASADADADGINVKLRCRRSFNARDLRVSWVINCTGPGTYAREGTHPILRPLIDAGILRNDPLGLGLDTDAEGRALNANGEAHPNLLVAGTLRKATLWESTAVPELRQQAATAAQIATLVSQTELSGALKT